MEIDKTTTQERTPEQIEAQKPRPGPKIPVRVIDSVKDIENAPCKTLKGTRSNHYILVKNAKKSGVVIFTNQKIFKFVVVDADECRIVVHDSVVITTREIELINVRNCSILFDEVDIRKINMFGCENVRLQFQNENTLIDEMMIYLDKNSKGNSVERIRIVPGTDPNKDPLLPVEVLKVFPIVHQVDESKKEQKGKEEEEEEDKNLKEEKVEKGGDLPDGLVFKTFFTTKALSFENVVLTPEERINRVPSQVHDEIQEYTKQHALLDAMTSDQLGDMYLEEVREYLDTPEDFQAKVKKVADAIRGAKHCVVFTGAGISTSAKLPDYRGPRGAWTVQANPGKTSHNANSAKKLTQAFPTYSHYALAELMRRDLIKYIVSTNMDGLHRRSGIPGEKLTEIHGNCYREVCVKCGKEYLRGFDTLDTRMNIWTHLTGRLCSCGGNLRDTIVHFTENWSLPQEVERGTDNCYEADVAIAMGSSMLVQPAIIFPTKTLKNKGKLVIVTLQHTPYDDDAFVKIYAKTDDFMNALMKELEIGEFDQTYDHLLHLPPDDSTEAPQPPQEPQNQNEGDVPKTGKGCLIQ